MSLSDKRLGGPGNTKVHGFFAELTLESFDSNDKMLNKNFATSFTSTYFAFAIASSNTNVFVIA